MDNPNPILYSDLVKPDNSITDLIAQLDELIAKYNGLKSQLQSAAAEAAKSMQLLSGATEDQREQIIRLTNESDKLVSEYEKMNDEERKAQRQKIALKQAEKEQMQIDKLLVEIQNSKEGSYKRLSAQYRLNKIRLNEMSAEERKAAGVGKELETETRKIYEEMSRLQKATGKYTLEVGHYENALRGLPGPIGMVVNNITNMRSQLGNLSNSSLPAGTKAIKGFGLVLGGVVGILLVFVRGLSSSIKTLAEFEQANANLSTILGTTQKEMEALTKSALSLGRTTEYTARQVVQLQTELAKLGFGQGSIITMQKYVLQFATAVGANLADAAQVAGATLRAFNLTSADTEDVLATLAVATNKSALSFEKIQNSIGTVFPVANAFGLSVKDTTALLGALANAGFDASSAATATRNIILKLADSNGKLAKSLGGAAKDFDSILNGMIELRQRGIDLNEALEITDKRSVAAFSAFLSGAESARELRQSLEDVSGELDRIQRQRLETVEGSTKLLKSAWEGLTLAFQNSNGVMKSTIDWLTKLINKTRELVFPAESAAQNWTDIYSKQFSDLAMKNGEDAKKQIEGTVQQLQAQLARANQKLAETPSIFAIQTAKAAKAVEKAENQLKGALAAQSIAYQQINDLEAERARLAQESADAEKKAAEELSKEQLKAIEAAKKQRIADRRAVIEAINLEISVTEAGTQKMLDLRLDKVEAERQLELEINRQKTETERQDEAAINAKYDKMALDTKKVYNDEVSKLAVQRLQAEQQAIQLEIAITQEGTQEMLALRLANIEKQRQIEIEQNKQKAENVRQSEKAINAKYDALALKEAANFNNKLAQRDLKAAQELADAEFSLLNKNERQKTIFRLEQEKARLEAILRLNETAAEKMTEMEVASIKATIKKIQKKISDVGYSNLYEVMGIGITSNQQDALNTAIGSIKDSVDSLIDSWNKLADAALNAANQQVDAAQKVLDAEIEARNAGYANEVATAQKELDLAKKNQEKAQKEKEKAQKAQLAMDTITQASSLITATAQIWSALGGIPYVGPALALAAIGTMWGSFAIAKIKAAEVTNSEQYGEGTVEMLEGGSHASGNDIDLGRKKDGTRRRAEGGEFFAVINKRNSRRYRDIIPDVINSFNDGTFAEKYQKANAAMDAFALNMMAGGVDISGLEKDVSAIREQGEETRYIDERGMLVIRYKNLTRRIKK